MHRAETDVRLFVVFSLNMHLHQYITNTFSKKCHLRWYFFS